VTSILIIEDDSKTADALCSGLRGEGYDVSSALAGDAGLRLLESKQFDVVVLDWMLPTRSGIDILKSLRDAHNRTPVLLLTARDAIEDRVVGLDAGADDYLIKPFAFAELLARLRALLRRSGDAEPLRRQVGDLEIDLEHRRASRGGKPIALTPREFDLLFYMARHAGQIVTRQMIARDVWREINRATPLDNVIDVHVAHLRRKVDDGHAEKLIHTARGVGFTLGQDTRRA
jgi:two-component system, OmpR family, copper resistance phosphate regulon response regulator CusR